MVYALVISVEREHYIDVIDLLVNAVGYNILATNPFIDEYLTWETIEYIRY